VERREASEEEKEKVAEWEGGARGSSGRREGIDP
jgi:hypothetical protein